MAPLSSRRLAEAHDLEWPSDDRPVPPTPSRLVLQVTLAVGALAFSIWTLYKLAAVVFVLIVAALFAHLIAPLVQLAERPIRLGGRLRWLSRGTAIGFVYVLLAASAFALAALLLPIATRQLDDIVARAPGYAQSMLTWKDGWSGYYDRLRIPLELRQIVDASVLAANEITIESARGSLLAFAAVLVSRLPWLVLIPVLAFFLLKDGTTIRRTIVAALPHQIRLRGHRLFDELNATLAAYIRAQLLAGVLVGGLCGLGFVVLGIPYPLLLGVLAGLLEFIPLVGPLLLAIVAAIVAALHAPMLAVWALGFLAVLRPIEDYLIYPRLIRRGLKLHPLAVIVAVLMGAELGGVAGVFMAIPITAIAAVVYRHWLQWNEASWRSDAR